MIFKKQLLAVLTVLSLANSMIATENTLPDPVKPQQKTTEERHSKLYSWISFGGIMLTLGGLVYFFDKVTKQASLKNARELLGNSSDLVRTLERSALKSFKSDLLRIVDKGESYPIILKQEYQSLLSSINDLSNRFSQAKKILPPEEVSWLSLAKLKINLLRLLHCERVLRKKLYKIMETSSYQGALLQTFKNETMRKISSLEKQVKKIAINTPQI